MRYLVLMICLLVVSGCNQLNQDQTKVSSWVTQVWDFSTIELFSESDAMQYIGETKDTLNEWLILNQWIISKQDIFESWEITALAKQMLSMNGSITQPFSTLYAIDYQDSIFIFASLDEDEGQNRPQLQLITSWAIDLITTTPQHQYLSNILMKAHSYSWESLSWAIDYIDRLLGLWEDCVTSSYMIEWINQFSFWPSENTWNSLEKLRTEKNLSVEEYRNALSDLQCYKGGEYYNYIRYPRLQKIFAILHHGKNWWGYSLWQFKYIWIRTNDWVIKR